jgi:hypothetical protein
MSVKIWIGNEYDQTGESTMVADVIKSLYSTFEPLETKFHILCNFDIPGYPSPRGRAYTSNLDMAVLSKKQFVILELKNYKGILHYGDSDTWYCETNDQQIVTIKGGKTGRTPYGQVRDYRNQMANLISNNAPSFLSSKNHLNDFRRFISTIVVFPDYTSEQPDQADFLQDRSLWLKVLRLNKVVETICQFGGGPEINLDDEELLFLIEKVLALRQAHMVGHLPMLAKSSPAKIQASQFDEQVALSAPAYPATIREEYVATAAIWNSNDSDLIKVQEFVKLFRRIMWNKIKETYKETEVKSIYSGIQNLLHGNPELIRHTHSLRRLGNSLKDKDKDAVVTPQDVSESFKTLCLLVQHLYAQDIPELLYKACGIIKYRDAVRYDTPGRMPQSIHAQIESINSDEAKLSCIDLDFEDGREFEVSYGETEWFKDIHSLVTPGDHICIVTPYNDGGAFRPSAIVLEPDYLLSPQRIGEAYSYEKPEIYFWLSLFEDGAARMLDTPGNRAVTMAQYILRGNFANTSLADYCVGDNANASKRMTRFIASNIMEVTAAMNEAHDDWLRECYKLDANLQRFLSKTIPDEHNVPVGNWQIEAPLYSPVYGLSARADAISYESRGQGAAVLELKTGKWDNFRGNRPQKNHAVQPVFYGDLLFFSRNISRDNAKQLLCYSTTIEANQRAPENRGKLFTSTEIAGVLPGGTSAPAIRSLSQIRNRIIHVGKLMRTGQFRKEIENLQPDNFRPAGMNDNFWSSYKRPPIENLLYPLQRADELSKRYFYRQLSFVAEEEYQARVGEKEADIGRGGSSSFWRLGTRTRQEIGLQLSNLNLISDERDALGRVTKIVLNTEGHHSNAGCSIRNGDSVCFYMPDKEDPNITNSIVFAAQVEERTADSIKLQLTEPQQAALLKLNVPGAKFVVEPIPSTYMSSSYSGLRYFLTGDTRRRQLVLNEIKPEIAHADNLPMCETELVQRYPTVAEVVRNAWQAKDWYLIWGPPGTGKTSTAMKALVDLTMATPQKRILLLAYTYRATDEICKMLDARLEEPGHQNDQYIRIGNPLKCDPLYRDKIPNRMGFEQIEDFGDAINRVKIVVATIAAITPEHPIFRLFSHFDLAVVDEASQLLDTHVLPLFCAKSLINENGQPISDGEALISKFIFIGDHKQLPAVVKQNPQTSKIEDNQLREKGIKDCRHSFFERLWRIAGGENAAPSLVGFLSTQYRMHPTIADFCNKFFYGEKLLNGNADHQMQELPQLPEDATPFDRYVLSNRMGFFPVIKSSGDSDTKVNPLESEIAAKIILILTTQKACTTTDSARSYKEEEIGIIVPFRNQIANVRYQLTQIVQDQSFDPEKILVDTVERFQGSERPVIIFTTVIQNLYQSDMLSAKRFDDDDDDGDEDSQEIDRKLNVAITRAQERFYLVGNENVLRGLKCYSNLVEWISNHAGFYENS